jgi:hypothetical protein
VGLPSLHGGEKKRWVRAGTAASTTQQPADQPAVSVGTSQSQIKNQKASQIQALSAALSSQFQLTKLTADGKDIVTGGSVLVLHKDGLLMFSTDTRVSPTSTYKDGKLSMGFGTTLAIDIELGQLQPGANAGNVPQRKFVTGEKFWIVALTAKDDGIILVVYSDPYGDVRYYGQVKFPFQKHTVPPVDDVLKTISEVVTVQPEENPVASTPAQPPASPSPAPATQAVNSLAPIAPPPPPADTPPAPPKTIALGQTVDQVVATFGQPQKVVKLGAKEIYVYSDMKVTFVNGKVSDVQ